MKLRSLACAVALLAAACLHRGETSPTRPSDSAESATGEAAPAQGDVVQGAPDGAPAQSPAAVDEPRRRPEEPLNVLVIVVDGMREDMPWAGYPRDIAPNLAALYARSVSYRHGYSVSSYTAKSIAALLSGQYPSSLKRSGHFFTIFPENDLFFPELLQEAGVHTVSTQAGTYLRRGVGLDQGFERWETITGVTTNPRSPKFITSKALTELTIDVLSQSPADQLRFLYVHYMDPHEPYLKHHQAPQFGYRVRDRYDGEIWFTDYWVGKLLDYCRQQPWWQQTAVIVTGDHGEAFGEHGRQRHGFALWEVLVRVPLFFRLPGLDARQIDLRRSHIDLAPTILELMGQPPSEQFVGQSLVAELYGAEAPPRPILLDLPADTNNPEVRAVVQGDWKLIVHGNDYSFALYDLASDPGEKKDLAKRDPERLQQMKKLYRELWDAVPDIKAFGGMKLMNGELANGPAN